MRQNEIINFIFLKIQQEYGFSRKIILSKTRQKDVAFARILTGALLKHFTNKTLHGVANIMQRDHSTICYYSREVMREPIKNQHYNQLIKEINYV